MSNFNLESVLNELSEERKIFVSEADFQLALAWKIKEEYNDAKVRCEYPLQVGNEYMHIDIMVIREDEWIPIELKYKTSSIEVNGEKGICIGEEKYNLKNQSAQDIGRYDYLRDIERIEKIKKSKIKIGKVNCKRGFTIMISNDPLYRRKPQYKKQEKGAQLPNYYQFSLHETEKGEKVHNIKKRPRWHECTGDGTKKGREHNINLTGTYECNWKPYSQIDASKNNIFKYLIHEIS